MSEFTAERHRPGLSSSPPADVPAPMSVGVPPPETLIAGGARRAWAEADGVFWGTPQSHDTLPVGLYRMSLSPNLGHVFTRQQNDTDALILLPDSESARIVAEIRAFKGLRSNFQKHGFLYKRGILLWGPPGSGKTCTLQVIVKMLMEEHDCIAVLIEEPYTAATCLQALRRIEPDRQVVAIMEDLDALCDRYDESAYLALLDGESQIDNIVYLATSNYPERLDPRFKNRPSRFDTVRHIGMPSDEARATYLRAKLPDLSETEITGYVQSTKGYSIAHLRELIILTCCFGNTLAAAVERIDAARFDSPNSERDSDRRPAGFTDLQ